MTIAKEFHLLTEPWIVVMKHDGSTEEVNLSEIFRRAPEFKRLAGELPTQDIAVLRLLLAILHCVIGRYDLDERYDPVYLNPKSEAPEEQSEEITISLAQAAIRRWQQLWERGEFPNERIQEYLGHFSDRFWLFHPTHPFYQVPGMDKATDYTAAKLNGELLESSNKIRLFASRGGAAKGWLNYAEAARWLLYVNGYDDTSAKPKGKDLPSPGAGWLGKLGLITAAGRNLFETLMLNLVLARDGSSQWRDGYAIWEESQVRSRERCEIVLPDNPAELLTLQSRRLLLKREGDRVTGYSLLGGDFFPPENAFAEQMTMWRSSQQKKGASSEYRPRRHDPARQLWRDLSALFVLDSDEGPNKHRPGIITWLYKLLDAGLIQLSQVHIQIAAVKYGDKDFFVDDVFSDGLTFHSGLLSHLAEPLIRRILDEIQVTDLLVRAVGSLAKELAKASGDTEAIRLQQAESSAKEQAYYRLDQPFRRWLEEIDPEKDEPRDLSVRWWQQAQSIVRKLGRELIERCDSRAIVGRVVKEKDVERRYTAPQAYDRFLFTTRDRDSVLKGGKHEPASKTS